MIKVTGLIDISSRALRRIPRILERIGIEDDVRIITGGKNSAIIALKVAEYLNSGGFATSINEFTGEAEYTLVESLARDIGSTYAVIGVGGGKVIDISKYVARRLRARCIIVPSSLSTDAIASPWSILKHGKRLQAHYVGPPTAVSIDLDVIKKSAYKLTASGFGDYISKFSALFDWRLEHEKRGAPYSLTASDLAKSILRSLIGHAEGIKALQEESLRMLAMALYLDGLLMELAGSTRVAAGSEHLFSFALDKVAEKPSLHGLECAVGTIMMTRLQGGEWETVKEILERAGAPTTASELGVKPEEVVEALVKAREQREWYTILDEKPLNPDAARKLAKETGVI